MSSPLHDGSRLSGRSARVVFVMEQHIGHQTYYRNLRSFIEETGQNDGRVSPRWVEVNYRASGPASRLLALLPGSLKSALAGRRQVVNGLKGGYDLAFFNTQVPAALALDAVRHKPYLLSTDITPLQYDRMALHYGHRADRAGAVGQAKHRLNRRLFQGAARILPWSPWAARSLVDEYGVRDEQVEVLSPGVNLEVWKPGLSQSAPVQEGAPVSLLFVGADFERKGGRVLLDAFRCLTPGMAELHLVTRSSLAPEPGVKVHNHLQPNSPELIALYQAADIFVLPSLAEAFGIAAIEAGAAGLPVVASRVGGLGDIVMDGTTGCLVAPGEPDALADRLLHLCRAPELRRKMGAAGRARAEASYDARKNFTRIVDIIVDTIAGEGEK